MDNFWTVKILRFVSVFFLGSVCIAMYFYPGGNIHDPEQIGYSFTHNFLSDLGGYQSHSDEVNFISGFFFQRKYVPLYIGWSRVFLRANII